MAENVDAKYTIGRTPPISLPKGQAKRTAGEALPEAANVVALDALTVPVIPTQMFPTPGFTSLDSASDPAYPYRLRTPRACDRCRKRKQGCVAIRPCPRCVAAGCADTCCDTDGKRISEVVDFSASVMEADGVKPPAQLHSSMLPNLYTSADMMRVNLSEYIIEDDPDQMAINSLVSSLGVPAEEDSSEGTAVPETSPLDTVTSEESHQELVEQYQQLEGEMTRMTLQNMLATVQALKDRILMGHENVPRGLMKLRARQVIFGSSSLTDQEREAIQRELHWSLSEPLRDYTALIDHHFAVTALAAEGAPVGIICSTLDPTNRRVYMNDKAAELIGMPKEFMIQKLEEHLGNWSHVFRVDDAHYSAQAFFNAAIGRKQHYACRIVLKQTAIDCVLHQRIVYGEGDEEDQATPVLTIGYICPVVPHGTV